MFPHLRVFCVDDLRKGSCQNEKQECARPEYKGRSLSHLMVSYPGKL